MKRNRSRQSPLSLFSFQDIITSVTGVIMLITLFLAVELTMRKIRSPEPSSREVVGHLQEAIAEAENKLVKFRAALASRASLGARIGQYTEYTANAEQKAVAEEIAILQEKIQELRNSQRTLSDEVEAAKVEWTNRVADVDRLEDVRQQRLALEAELTDLKNSRRVFYSATDTRGREVLLVELFESDILVAQAGQQKAPQRFSGSLSSKKFLDWAFKQFPSKYRFVIIVHPGTTHAFQGLRKGLREKGFSIGFDLLPETKVAIDLKQGAG